MQQGEGTDTRLREAARKLIGAYMADEDLAPHINALEAAAGFCQQGAEPPEPEWEYRVIYPDGSATYPETRDLAVTWAARGGGRVERCIARRARARGEWEALPDD